MSEQTDTKAVEAETEMTTGKIGVLSYGPAGISISGITETVDLAVGLATAYVENNRVAITELPELLKIIHKTLVDLNDNVGGASAGEASVEAEVKSAAEIKKSIKPDGLISFIDGKAYKTLKRHLSKHGLTVEQYKAKYGLPVDYPTTSANYSAQRSALAKATGLGQQAAKAA